MESLATSAWNTHPDFEAATTPTTTIPVRCQTAAIMIPILNANSLVLSRLRSGL
jgi:hypothetical protein